MILACVDVPSMPITAIDTRLNLNQYGADYIGYQGLGMEFYQAIIDSPDQRYLGNSFTLNYNKKLMVLKHEDMISLITLIKDDYLDWSVISYSDANLFEYLNFSNCQAFLHQLSYGLTALEYQTVQLNDRMPEINDCPFIRKNDAALVDLFGQYMSADDDMIFEAFSECSDELTQSIHYSKFIGQQAPSALNLYAPNSINTINYLLRSDCTYNPQITALLQGAVNEIARFYNYNQNKYYAPNDLIRAGYLSYLISILNMHPVCRYYVDYNLSNDQYQSNWTSWCNAKQAYGEFPFSLCHMQFHSLLISEIYSRLTFNRIIITLNESRQIVVQVLNQNELIAFTIVDLDILNIGTLSIFPRWFLDHSILTPF